jgi:uncharacterized membrane protein affecting hemolysin expression
MVLMANNTKGTKMNSFLITVRNIALLSFLAILITYIVVLMQINGVLPASELSNSVIQQVIANLGE